MGKHSESDVVVIAKDEARSFNRTDIKWLECQKRGLKTVEKVDSRCLPSFVMDTILERFGWAVLDNLENLRFVE